MEQGFKQGMTAAEFIAYWLATDEDGRSLFSYNEENLSERQAQYASECAMFGDAGPGQGLVIREIRAELIGAHRRLVKLGAV